MFSQVSDERHEGKGRGFEALSRNAVKEPESWQPGTVGVWEAVSKEKQKAEDERKRKVSEGRGGAGVGRNWEKVHLVLQGKEKDDSLHRTTLTLLKSSGVFFFL